MKIKKIYRLHSFLKGLGRYKHQNGWKSEYRSFTQGSVWIPMRTVRPTGAVSITTTQGIQSRYAMKIINSGFYGTITID